MKIKNLTLSTLFLTLGLVLHITVPGTVGFMKPDFMLAMFFFALFGLQSFREVIVVSIVCGFLTAMTTAMPGGEVANVIDKLITGPLVFYGYQFLVRKLDLKVSSCLITCLGTCISGLIFLSIVQVLGGISLPLQFFLLGIILPAMVVNSILVLLISKVMERIQPKKEPNLHY
ncbi:MULTISPECIES: tryptophan transporter [Erysipelothrix]|uniref:YhaG family tryptophan uptake permease n=1 Tax=Erysipelothrix piscisicarius TaxID=2485784 RepID=A0A3Q8S7D4_9FIRM|nr:MULTISPECIES: tryptophan transporter [Erysipelothrix]AZK44118.1 YhaG family tryptophan uptake permease [Erysipelothrix piscisicarius]MBK2402745.1 YhaG family tryptophan uptake permease [Erysipelothrix sp. strain 2 (EsS2-6-Brazil)]MBK2404164.1 YhaG family tryptophan uptake permease [Erysipelothrix sp. strain 2 (EsS2-7-Brazil)]NBA01885.1 YhaG family tryptophan uptake permease [Erysipelothrix rhusiopathiae]